MADNTVKFQKVWDISDQLELVKGESATGWTGSTDVSNIATSTTHRTGATSLSFDKDGTTETTGIISKTLKNKNANLFALEKLRALINLSSLTDIASISIRIGADSSNYNLYTVTDTDLSTGWNELIIDCDSPTSVTGNGINWYSIGYIAVVVTFDAAGDTLTSILVDSIEFFRAEKVGGSGIDGTVEVSQKTIPGAENNDLNLYAVHFKPTSSATDKGTNWTDLSFTNEVVKSSAGAILGGWLYNSTASTDIFLQFHDSPTAVSASAVPDRAPILLKPSESTFLDIGFLGPNGNYFANGINVTVSSTAGTFTAVSAGDVLATLIVI